MGSIPFGGIKTYATISTQTGSTIKHPGRLFYFVCSINSRRFRIFLKQYYFDSSNFADAQWHLFTLNISKYLMRLGQRSVIPTIAFDSKAGYVFVYLFGQIF